MCIRDRGEDREKTEPWEVYFREDEADAGRISSRPAAEQREEKEEEFQTVLLAARPLEMEGRKLTAFSGNLEIPLTYFPFLIGKSREMADFCLNEPGVSRLHVKIEEKDGAYTITDLNSTNGTKVNGTLLEANATCSLEPVSYTHLDVYKRQVSCRFLWDFWNRPGRREPDCTLQWPPIQPWPLL